MAAPRLLLVGGGHAHVEILRRLILDRETAGRAPVFDVTLISLGDFHHYSGMAPGFLLGTYAEAELRLDLRALAARGGCRFLSGSAVALQPEAISAAGARAGTVVLDGGERVPYDLVSLNVGSLAAGADRVAADPRVALVKPIARIVEFKARLDALAAAPAGERRLLVVGGGAAGVEIAFAGAAVLDRAAGGRAARRVTLVEAGAQLLPDYDARCRRRVAELLARRHIEVRCGAKVAGTAAAGAQLADGGVLPVDLLAWLTGPAAPALFAGSGLPLDRRGFLLVDDTLRSPADPRVFAAGDCATLARHPATPKAGVYAVREAPILWQSLLAAAHGTPPPHYIPQASFLSLLNTADGRALLRWRGILLHSRSAWLLKDWIDRSFIQRYQRLEASRSIPPEPLG